MRLTNTKDTSLSVLCIRALAIGSALVGIVMQSALAQKNDNAIQFSKDAISSVVTGKLAPDVDEQWYHFSATSQQYAVINIAPLAGTPETASVGVLHIPNGTQDGTKGGIIYQGCLSQTGKYRLRIARNLMATRNKTAGYKVEVMILPTYASEPLCKDSLSQKDP